MAFKAKVETPPITRLKACPTTVTTIATNPRRPARRRELGEEEVLPSAGTSSTVIERRAYGSGVLQLEKRGESGPYWYFHHRKDGMQKTIYLGKTDAPEIKLAQIKGGIGG